MSRFKPIVRSWSAISRSLPQFAPARRPHARRRQWALGLERLEDRVALSTFTVSNTLDSMPGQPPVDGSLRQAIERSDSTLGPNEIDFAPGLSGTITLTGGQLTIMNNAVTIMGPGAKQLSVSGNNTSRVIEVDLVHAALSGLTITGGSVTPSSIFISVGGGGLYNNGGMVTITACAISGNSVSDFSFGGGIFNSGTVTIAASTLNGNFAGAGGGISNSASGTMTIAASTLSGNFGSAGFPLDKSFGGGIDNKGTVTVTNSTLSGNSAAEGGGIDNKGTVTVTNSTLSGNSAAEGGGIDNEGGTLVRVADSTLSGNSANFGGGIENQGGTVTVANSTLSGNSGPYFGGGIDNKGGTVMVANSTLSGNSAYSSGGGIANEGGTVTVADSTLSGNSALRFDGGGIFNSGTVTIANSTLSGNSAQSLGGGIANEGGTVTLNNTIVALNTRYGGTTSLADDIFGTVSTSSAYNLIGIGGSGGLVNGTNGNQVGVANPLLAPLADYGGPTQTMALLPGSPAIDAGSNALAVDANGNPLTTDQRGAGFPRVINGTVDIGAFESSGFTIAVTSGSGQSTSVLTAFPAPLVVTVTANKPSEPVAGGLVTFTPPSSGASATLRGSPATISATGTASVTATANGVVGSYTVSATASGITTPASFSLTNNQSIIVLDPSAGGALSLSDNARINIPGVIYVDSSSSSALSASGNAQVKAAAIDVDGGVQKRGNASLSPTPVTGAAVLADPLAGLALPSTSGLTNYGAESLSGNSSATIQPGIYSQITVSGNAKLTMSSGIYIIEGGGFSVAGTASVTGSGVMIFNAGSKYTSTGGTYGSITLGGNGTCNLSPATSGIYAGIVFFQPLDNTKAISVTGNASGIAGTIYAPAAPLSESGNAALDASLIVDTLTISGNGVADG